MKMQKKASSDSDAIAVIACDVLRDEIAALAAACPRVVHVHMLQQGLHNDPPELRWQLQQAVDHIEKSFPAVQVIVLGYGLCSRGIEGVKTVRCRLVIPRAHDCITLLMGDKDRYAQYVRQYPGTYWYSPGWNRCHTPPGPQRYEKLYRQYVEKFGEEDAKYLMETEQAWFSKYNRAAWIDMGIAVNENDVQYTRECAVWLGWEFDRVQGSPELLKSLLSGDWDSSRFLVLAPGQEAKMTADEQIITVNVPARQSLLVEHPRGSHRLFPTAVQLQLPLSELLRQSGLPLNTRCGQRGLCDGCLIELLQGQLIHVRSGQSVQPGTTIRGCEHRLGCERAVSIRIPQRSALGYEPRVLSDFRLNVPFSHNPLYKPACGDVALGAAVDIGTTTVALLLVDLADGKIVGRSSAFNEQMRLGDDVVTRITLCRSDPAMLNELQRAVAERTILPLLTDALRQAGATAGQIKCICFAGNTTMLHLLIGEDPSPMGVAPFKPAFVDHRVVPAGEIFRSGGSFEAVCHLLPSAAAYVGADLTAGAVASGLIYDDGPSLLVDVGTNGEIILKYNHHLFGCATAAGPAFEGAGLSSGMRAGDGAISGLRIENDFSLRLEQIGQGRPVGLCGSAYIDFLAEGRRVGLLNTAGRFADDVPQPLRSRISRLRSNDQAFTVAATSRPITITQLDVARLLQAKAAIAAGILTLLDRVGMKPADVKRLYLAGGFGTHMNVANAVAAGLLPGFQTDQIQPVGNTALGGAYVALMDQAVLDEISRAGRQIEVIELNQQPGFESHYIDQLVLP